MTEIRVLVADDHAVVREGIRSILDGTEGIEWVGEAIDGNDALARIAELDPDVAVLDISMPHRTGLEVLAILRRNGRRPRVLILSMHDHPEYVLEAVRAGADGYLLKNAAPAEFRRAIMAIARGETVFAGDVVRQLGTAIRGEAVQQRDRRLLEELTPREREVLARVAAGRTSRDIAQEFGISPRTVETHRESIMRKLDIRTVAGLTRFALEVGLHHG
jgi:DNA-binding NarL/FixJ family response regulator